MGLNMQARTRDDDANAFGYPPRIWQLFEAAPRAGRFEPGTPGVVAGKAGTPAARSVLSLELRFDRGRVVDARFRAYGCPSSIAVGAWIAQWSQNREPAELAALTAAKLRSELEIPEDRAHCALMGEDALRDILSKIKT
jgi:NifU-like protein involved in Fe-S cluster formation